MYRMLPAEFAKFFEYNNYRWTKNVNGKK